MQTQKMTTVEDPDNEIMRNLTHVGKLIQEVKNQKKVQTGDLADQINRVRGTVQNMFNKSSIDVDLLYNISIALDHNFFEDLSRIYRQRHGDPKVSTELVTTKEGDHISEGVKDPIAKSDPDKEKMPFLTINLNFASEEDHETKKKNWEFLNQAAREFLEMEAEEQKAAERNKRNKR